MTRICALAHQLQVEKMQKDAQLRLVVLVVQTLEWTRVTLGRNYEHLRENPFLALASTLRLAQVGSIVTGIQTNNIRVTATSTLKHYGCEPAPFRGGRVPFG